MKSNLDFSKDIIRQVQAKRKKKRAILTSVTLGACALFAFLIGFSNVFTLDYDRFATSYTGYLRPYIAQADEGVAFRFVDEKSALVQIDEQAYPCTYEATSKRHFTLSVVEEESKETPLTATEEEPSIFYLEFWDTSAKLSWNILGLKVEKILSVTDERDIPAGLWSLCATQNGDDGQIVEKKNGAGWTLILENGDSYTGEGMDSSWKTKFISIGNTLFQCMFDPISGVILDASVFVYDETTFDYPVIRENYLSDGDPYYFYSRLLSEEERLDFTGGTFTAATVIRESENHFLESPTKLHKEVAKWQLLPDKSQAQTTLSVHASLSLTEDGKAKLKISGDTDYNGTFSGKWYALKHSILVALDKKSSLVGRVFTVYANSPVEDPTGEFVQKYGESRIESYACYKVGYHVFDYYVSVSQAQIFWGSEWTPEQLTPTVKYEQEYVLYGEYYYEYFDGDPDIADANRKNFDESFLQPLPVNGQVKMVFHENGTVTVTLANGEVRELAFTLNEDGSRLSLEYTLYLYQGKNAVGKNPWYPNNVDKNCIVQLKYLEVGFTYLYHKQGESWSYSYKDENGKWVQEDYSQTFYVYRFVLQNG